MLRPNSRVAVEGLRRPYCLPGRDILTQSLNSKQWQIAKVLRKQFCFITNSWRKNSKCSSSTSNSNHNNKFALLKDRFQSTRPGTSPAFSLVQTRINTHRDKTMQC